MKQLTRRQFAAGLAGGALTGLAGTSASSQPLTQPQARYTLKCEYLYKLQVTTGLSEAMLSHPSLFALCSSRLGTTDSMTEHWKYSSGDFDAGLDPRRWPDGKTRERRLGPWRHLSYSDALVHAADRDFLFEDCCHNSGAAFRAEWVADQMLSARGMDGLKYPPGLKDGDQPPAVFDLQGINAGILDTLDNAEWRFKKTGSRAPAVRLPEGKPVSFPTDYVRLHSWQFGSSSARLWWNGDALIEEPMLHRWGQGFNTLQSFDTVGEALLQLALHENTTDKELLQEVVAGEGEDSDRWINNAILYTTVIDASGLCCSLTDGARKGGHHA